MSGADHLEGEILLQRYAVVQVHSSHAGWVRCLVYDMQELTRREAVVQLGQGEPQIELLPEDHTPVVPEPAPKPEPEPPPEPPAPAEPAPTPPVPEPPAPPPPAPAPAPESPPEVPRSGAAKPGRLEAAWFAAGDQAEEVAEEDRPADEGDIVIAPSKVEQAASDITTGTYMRYRLDTTSNRVPSPSPPAPSGAALPSSKLPLPLILAGCGVLVLLAVLWVVLR